MSRRCPSRNGSVGPVRHGDAAQAEEQVARVRRVALLDLLRPHERGAQSAFLPLEPPVVEPRPLESAPGRNARDRRGRKTLGDPGQNDGQHGRGVGEVELSEPRLIPDPAHFDFQRLVPRRAERDLARLIGDAGGDALDRHPRERHRHAVAPDHLEHRRLRDCARRRGAPPARSKALIPETFTLTPVPESRIA